MEIRQIVTQDGDTAFYLYLLYVTKTYSMLKKCSPTEQHATDYTQPLTQWRKVCTFTL